MTLLVFCPYRSIPRGTSLEQWNRCWETAAPTKDRPYKNQGKTEHPDEVSEQIQLVLRNSMQLYATLAERTNTTHTNTLSLLFNNLLEKAMTQPATEERLEQLFNIIK